MEEDELDSLKDTKDYLEEFMRRAKSVQDAVPHAQRHLDSVKWQLAALQARPDEADEIPSDHMSDIFSRENTQIRAAFPLPPHYESVQMYNSFVNSTAGTATVSTYVFRVGELGTPSAIEYAQFNFSSYQKLQQSQNRPEEVRYLIAMLGNSKTLDQFDKALSAYLSASAHVTPRTHAATEIRTLLDKIKGDLWQKARTHAKEDMTWERMARKLAKNGPNGQECKTVVDQDKTRSYLIGELSDILKDREGQAPKDLSVIWSQCLDYMFITLSLLNF